MPAFWAARQATPGRAPQTVTERRIAALFADVLQQEIGSVDDDFFALGGHSLLAMRLAALLRRDLGGPVTVGQVMVASSVAGLAALFDKPADTIADSTADGQGDGPTGDDARRSGLDAVLPLRHGDGPPLFCFHPASGFAWQFSVLRRYLDPRWPLVGIQSPRPGGPLQNCANLEQVCDAHLLTVRGVQPHGPYHFIGYSLGGTLAQGIAARLRAAGETVAFLGLLDTYPPETRNWDAAQGKHVLDPEVLEEVRRERGQFIAAQRLDGADPAGGEQRRLFDAIEGNYADSVRLLAASRSAYFAGEATLVVARRQRAGAIVSIASNAAQAPRVGMSAYCASKAALRSLCLTVGLEMAPFGVRCNLVSPGSTDTPLQRGLWQNPDAEQQTIAGFPEQFKLGIPLGKIARPREIADAVLFLASERAGHITMQDIVIDGGATLGA